MNLRVMAVAVFGGAIVTAIVCLALFLLVSDRACIQSMRGVAEAIVGGTLIRHSKQELHHSLA